MFAFAESRDVPDFSIEEKLLSSGKQLISGIDEVGRGPLAGPVVAAAVILDPDRIPEGLNDSKKLSAKRREAVFSKILTSAHVSWCALPATVIDRINIRAAALKAMEISFTHLPVTSGHALIDGKDVPPGLSGHADYLIKGDSRSVSIAAASIVAKVIRDRIMIRADSMYPEYGFARHKGYGSKLHRDAIAGHGPCPLHRRSFSPIRQMVESG